MGDHISNSNLNIKDIINKDIVRKLCDVLDLDFYNITGSNPMFKFHGSMEENKYSVYSNIYSSMKNYKLEFKFTVNYPKRSDILTTEELSSNFSDEELNAVLDKRRDINYIFIQ